MIDYNFAKQAREWQDHSVIYSRGAREGLFALTANSPLGFRRVIRSQQLSARSAAMIAREYLFTLLRDDWQPDYQ